MMDKEAIDKEIAMIMNQQPNIDGLGALSKAVATMMALEGEASDLENRLALKNKELQHYKVEVIPAMMAELGLSEVKTQQGHRLTIQNIVSCKFIPEMKLRALNWLSEHGFGPLVKTDVSLSFGKDSEAAVDRATQALRAAGFQPEVDQTVHPSTLRAWATRQVEAGGPVPDDIFDVKVFSMVKVK